MRSRPRIAARARWRAGFGSGNVTAWRSPLPRNSDATASGKARWSTAVPTSALLQQAARCETLSSEDRAALANQIEDLAMCYLCGVRRNWLRSRAR
jgi:hypothetical protein